MAVENKNTLKSWFQRGKKPLATQFADWIDSYWHKQEKIPLSEIQDLEDSLNNKAEVNEIKNLENRIIALEKISIKFNLIHHFPLTYNGGLSDIIGNGLITPQADRFSWDHENNMYKTSSVINSPCAVISGLNLGMIIGEKPNNISFEMTIKTLMFKYNNLNIMDNLSTLGFVISKNLSSPPAIPVGKTSKFVVTYNGEYRKYYIDGIFVQDTLILDKTTITPSNNETINIGHSVFYEGNGEFCIKDIKIYDKTLTNEEVQSLQGT